MNDSKYLAIADAAVGLKGMNVLEVGGCVPPDILNSFSPESWHSIDINSKRVDSVNAIESNFVHRAEVMDARNMELPDNTYDRIYSINCFEHIGGMKEAFAEMYRVLKPGGMLFTLFGPIWSSPVGHHTYVETPEGVIHFNDHIFPDWAHVMNSEADFIRSIKGKFSNDNCERIAKYIYQSDDLNKLTDADYYRLISESGFGTILSLKNKKGRKLTASEMSVFKGKNIDNPRTTEILLVLRKGRFSIITFFRSLLGLAICKLKQR